MRKTKRAEQSFIKEMTILIKSTDETDGKVEIKVSGKSGTINELRKEVASVLVEQKKHAKKMAQKVNIHTRNLQLNIGASTVPKTEPNISRSITPKREFKAFEKLG